MAFGDVGMRANSETVYMEIVLADDLVKRLPIVIAVLSTQSDYRLSLQKHQLICIIFTISIIRFFLENLKYFLKI